MYATYECEIRGKKKRGTFTFIRGKGEYKGVMGIGAFASKLDTETLLCDIIEG